MNQNHDDFFCVDNVDQNQLCGALQFILTVKVKVKELFYKTGGAILVYSFNRAPPEVNLGWKRKRN